MQRIQNIFFVKSPLQLLNAREAYHFFGLDNDSCVLILMGDRKSYLQMAHLMQTMGEWRNIILLDRVGLFFLSPWTNNVSIDRIHNRKKRLSQSSFFRVWRLNRLARSVNGVENVFIGDNNNAFMRHFVNTLRHERTVLLDDGTATLGIARQRMQGIQKRQASKVPKKIKLAARRMFQGMKDQQPKQVTFFTSYTIETRPPDEIVQNDYTYIRESSGQLTSTDSIYFIGSPLSEVGFISEQAYLDQLSRVKADFEGAHFVYVAHRRESQKKLYKIGSTLGMEVSLFDYPIEYQVAVVGPRPKCVVSFFTSALDSLHHIMGNQLEIISYRLMEGSYNDRDRIDPIYHNYESIQDDCFKLRSL